MNKIRIGIAVAVVCAVAFASTAQSARTTRHRKRRTVPKSRR